MKPEQYLDHVKIRSPKLKRTFLSHAQDWHNCKACHLGKQASNHVLLRGKLPCDVLFIGEAPGDSEDTVGLPFVGPSGKLLTKIISEVESKVRFTYAIANTLACMPRGESGSARPPDNVELALCHPRLVEVVNMASAKGTVFVGKVAHARSPALGILESESLLIYHPAYLLRKGGASPNNLDYKRTVLQLQNYVKELLS